MHRNQIFALFAPYPFERASAQVGQPVLILFDFDRAENRHIAFGAGPHRCLGSHLARVELNIVYEELVKRLPPFRLDPERPAKFKGGHVIGVEELHLVWDN
mgnify:CR=1 FL=1